jgi:hypothetical protein
VYAYETELCIFAGAGDKQFITSMQNVIRSSIVQVQKDWVTVKDGRRIGGDSNVAIGLLSNHRARELMYSVDPSHLTNFQALVVE